MALIQKSLWVRKTALFVGLKPRFEVLMNFSPYKRQYTPLDHRPACYQFSFFELHEKNDSVTPYVFFHDGPSPLSFSPSLSPLSLFLSKSLSLSLSIQNLYHAHCDEATIQWKASIIITCFISCSVPPPLQINIPREQANSILEMRHTLGPYIFREAQVQSVYLPYML